MTSKPTRNKKKQRVVVAITLWIVLILLLAFHTLPHMGFSCEKIVRHTGMYLELLGLVIAVIGITETQLKLGNNVSFNQFMKPLKDLFVYKKKPQIIEASMNAHYSPNVSVIGVVGQPPAVLIEDRINRLEREILELAGENTRLDKKITEQSKVLDDALKIESDLREHGDDVNKKLMNDIASGGLRIELVGLLSIMLGIILATASSELVSFGSTCGLP